MDEDEELRLALEMSLLDAQQQADNGQPLSDEQLAIQLDKVWSFVWFALVFVL
jgi:hypothetical protein